MDKIIQCISLNDYSNDLKTSLCTMSHKNYVKSCYELSYIDYHHGTKDKIFMKLLKIIDNKPEFYTYGYLYKDKFVIDKSNQYVFKYDNLKARTAKKNGNDFYLIVVGDTDSYLLFNPYKDVVSSMFDTINK